MSSEALYAHLASGATTTCRAWIVARRDGLVLGFTDHDRDIAVEGITCRADTGMTARALQQTTGLSVDNSEAVGALSDAAVSEADILAGRYDGAEVRAFLVNWAAPVDVVEQFRGSLGEIQRAGGGFRAELRGMSERLNQAQGQAYISRCSAVLGDSRCRFATQQPGYFADRLVEVIDDGRMLSFASFAGFDDRWFEGGRLEVLDGAAVGLVGVVKSDRLSGTARRIELWQSIIAELAPGDSVRFVAGCDKSPTTCRTKFANFLNFRGFPHIPGDDWMTSYPLPDRPNTGGPRLLGGVNL
jgi:uncharacterized phage protein (TIGR02218 family)